MQNCIAKLFSAVLITGSRLVSFYEDKFADQQNFELPFMCYNRPLNVRILNVRTDRWILELTFMC